MRLGEQRAPGSFAVTDGGRECSGTVPSALSPAGGCLALLREHVWATTARATRATVRAFDGGHSLASPLLP